MKNISIIIPIYNAQDELRKSVDSVLAQTEKNVEVILVDDGSEDNSLQICMEYAAKDDRVVVIHQENAGVSAARNAGIDAATGAYIGFVDSDDWIEPNMYERMLAEAESSGADVVMCDATTVYEDGAAEPDTITQLTGNVVLQKSDFTPALLLEMAGAVWRCIYRNHICSGKVPNSSAVRFPQGVKFSEDRIFNLYALGYANKVSYLKESYYNRFMNKKSAVHRFHRDYFEACKVSVGEVEKAIRTAWDDDEAYQRAYLSQFINGAFGAINNYYYKTSPLSSADRRRAVKVLCNDRKLQNAIQSSGFGGRHSQWLLQKRVMLLIVYAKLANWKHGR